VIYQAAPAPDLDQSCSAKCGPPSNGQLQAAPRTRSRTPVRDACAVGGIPALRGREEVPGDESNGRSPRELYVGERLHSVLMSACSAFPGSSRPVSPTGVVLVVLLAALMHVLACAHGPTSTGMGHADAVIHTASMAQGQVSGLTDHEPSVQQHGPARDDDAHCCGTDEPTVQPPRHGARAVHAVHGALPPHQLGAQPSPAPPALRQTPPAPDASSAGNSRAHLGVWRT